MDKKTDRPEPHAVVRARERFGLELSTDDLREIARQCRDRRSTVANYGERSVHLVQIRGVVMKVVIQDGTIRTVLQPTASLRKPLPGKHKGKRRSDPFKSRSYRRNKND